MYQRFDCIPYGYDAGFTGSSTSVDEQRAQNIWAVPIEGGQARELANVEAGVNSAAMSPDGKSMVARLPAGNQPVLRVTSFFSKA